MSNMSYCRFQNTLSDLIDCKDALEGMMVGCDGDGERPEPLSRDELRAAKQLVDTCFEMISLVSDHLPGENVCCSEAADTFMMHYEVMLDKANQFLEQEPAVAD